MNNTLEIIITAVITAITTLVTAYFAFKNKQKESNVNVEIAKMNNSQVALEKTKSELRQCLDELRRIKEELENAKKKNENLERAFHAFEIVFRLLVKQAGNNLDNDIKVFIDEFEQILKPF